MPEAQQLQLRQARFVDAVVHGKTTQKQAAIDAGYSAKSIDSIASQVAGNPKVKIAIEQARQKKLDKAQGVLTRAEAMLDRFSRELDKAELAGLNVIELAQLQRNAVEVYGKTLELRDKFNLDSTDSTEQRSMFRSRLRRAVLRGVALGQGRKLLGYSIPHTTTAAEKG